jgi:hypothetical protein
LGVVVHEVVEGVAARLGSLKYSCASDILWQGAGLIHQWEQERGQVAGKCAGM